MINKISIYRLSLNKERKDYNFQQFYKDMVYSEVKCTLSENKTIGMTRLKV